jgi:predicted dehydrogenase
LYKTVLEKLGHEVITVDHDTGKGAMLSSVDAAILVYAPFDTVHICTPNFTHFEIAAKVAPVSKIVFIEKPGVANSNSWNILIETFKYTRFIMVKNNMWRSNIAELKMLASTAKTVKIKWIRKNCIPSPGSWFTTKKLAFGGVSRDLMPHLLSLYVAMNPHWRADTVNGTTTLAAWKLEDIDNTDYGTVNNDGTYNVDDFCEFEFKNGDTTWILTANWKDNKADDVYISFDMKNSAVRHKLGLCPEEAYKAMIETAVTNLNNDMFWKNQLQQDLWIHRQIENL